MLAHFSYCGLRALLCGANNKEYLCTLNTKASETIYIIYTNIYTCIHSIIQSFDLIICLLVGWYAVEVNNILKSLHSLSVLLSKASDKQIFWSTQNWKMQKKKCRFMILYLRVTGAWSKTVKLVKPKQKSFDDKLETASQVLPLEHSLVLLYLNPIYNSNQ